MLGRWPSNRKNGEISARDRVFAIALLDLCAILDLGIPT